MRVKRENPYSRISTKLFPHASVQNLVRLTGGVSADVFRADLALVDGSNKSVVFRVHGPTYSGHSADVEFSLLHALIRNGIPVPRPLFADNSGLFMTEAFVVTEFVDGTSVIPAASINQYIKIMADMLARVHSVCTTDLPVLPMRVNPLPEVLSYLPNTQEWQELRSFLISLPGTRYQEPSVLLHGDFWPGNLLWFNAAIVATLDWEDAALGDPLSDVACCLLELRYQFGREYLPHFLQSYTAHKQIDYKRLPLWQVYVAAAAQHYMHQWGLEKAKETHMRKEAIASIHEAGSILMGLTDPCLRGPLKSATEKGSAEIPRRFTNKPG